MKQINQQLIAITLMAAPFTAFIVCLGLGRYQISPIDTLLALSAPFSGAEIDPAAVSVIFSVRLPRLLLAFACGAGLSVAGAAFQALFGNPLATPDTLGVATGASFGAVIMLLFSNNMLLVQAAALVSGLVALLITCAISRLNGRTSIIMVVLSGMVVSALCQALVSLVKYVADPEDQLPAITYWLMGSMARATSGSLLLGVPFIAIGVGLLLLLRWRLNILSLQEDEARSLGIDVRKTRWIVMVASTMITASCVSMCGQVGWIGLLIPHAARMLCGSDNKKILPVSIFMGSTFMIVIDTFARAATAAEIPVSILTAVIGAPFFIMLLRQTGGAKL